MDGDTVKSLELNEFLDNKRKSKRRSSIATTDSTKLLSKNDLKTYISNLNLAFLQTIARGNTIRVKSTFYSVFIFDHNEIALIYIMKMLRLNLIYKLNGKNSSSFIKKIL